MFASYVFDFPVISRALCITYPTQRLDSLSIDLYDRMYCLMLNNMIIFYQCKLFYCCDFCWIVFVRRLSIVIIIHSLVFWVLLFLLFACWEIIHGESLNAKILSLANLVAHLSASITRQISIIRRNQLRRNFPKTSCHMPASGPQFTVYMLILTVTRLVLKKKYRRRGVLIKANEIVDARVNVHSFMAF